MGGRDWVLLGGGSVMAKCKICRAEFVKRSISHKVCGLECAAKFAKQERERKEAKEERSRMRQRKEALKSRSEHLKEAQEAFNAFIRYRDKDEPCISCGRYHHGQYHAGHYRSVGAAPELRFEELNVHKQCAPCNNHLSGNAIEYRLRLIKKIGVDKVEWLEGPHEPKKYTVEGLKVIKAEYRAKLKELKNMELEAA
jgi:hypothetical protein